MFMYSELKRMWEAALAYFKALFQNSLREKE
jgi:hypothetical protein